MSNLIRCNACNGRKRVLGIGGMEKNCSTCNAIGWIETPTIEPVLDEIDTAEGEAISSKKKSGRKPKNFIDSHEFVL